MRVRMARWLTQPAKRSTVVVLFLGLCGLLGLFAFEYESRGHIIHRDEHNTCVVQARGLYANQFLVRVVDDIHLLIGRPLTTPQKRRLARVGLLAIYDDLNASSFNYAWVQRRQPKHRKC